jgi:hypothetical protein
MKERKPATVQVYLELEDNCGAVIAKKKIEVPVKILGKDVPDEATARAAFIEWAKSLQAANLEMGM